MLSNPNMSLAEFTEKVGGLDLEPWQRELLRQLEQAREQGGRLVLDMSRRRSGSDYNRPVCGWLEKDTLTGEVHEPTTMRADEWNRR